MDLNLVDLPPLNYPFESRMNPHVEHIEALTFEWIEQDYERSMAESLRAFRHRSTLTGHFSGRMYPTASLERFIPIARFMLWGLVHDDHFESLDEEGMARVRDTFHRIMLGKQRPTSSDLATYRQMATLVDSCEPLMPREWIERFADSVYRYQTGMIEEIPFKRAMEWPTLEQYIDVRQKAVCVYPLFVLLELESEYTLPRQIVDMPEIVRLADLTCRILAWTNDYYSVRRESGRDVMNLILVCQHNMNLSLPEAYREAVRIHDRDVSEVVAICDSLPDFGEHQEGVRRFIQNLGLLLHGQKDWYELDTNRYPLVMKRHEGTGQTA